MATIQKGAGIVYTDGVPTHTPEAGSHSEVAIDVNTFTLYIYNRDVPEWRQAARAADERVGSIQVSPSDPIFGALNTGDSKAVLRIPSVLNGMNLTGVGAGLSEPSDSGNVVVQFRRVRAGVSADMLSTRITIEANEYDSSTAAAQPVIDTANDDVITGDQIHIDVDSAGTNAFGLVCTFTFTS